MKTLLVYLNDTKVNDPESGVKDFSWKQAKTNASTNGGTRKREEVMKIYFDLIYKYHLARLGKGDLKIQLEKWVLDN